MSAPHPPYYTAARLPEIARPPEAVRLEARPLPLGAWLLRPYLDLTSADAAAAHTLGIEAAYAQLVDPSEPFFAPQTHPQAVLRDAVVAEAGLEEYRIAAPADLAPELRTARWQTLVEHAERAADLPLELQLRLAVLLNCLGLYSATARLLPPVPDDRILGNPVSALLAMKRAHGAWKGQPTDETLGENLRVLELVAATRGPLEHHARLRAAVTLAVFYAKSRHRDPAQVRRWRAAAAAEYERLRPDGDWRELLYASAFWRGVSFLPFIEGDRAATKRELDQAEELARAFEPETPVQHVLYVQNLHPLLETRTKEALWAGDADLAFERARALTELDPFDPKVHVELADVLLQRDDPEAALSCYRTAARLGAPFTPFAYYMSGRCLERLGEPAAAFDAYRLALEADPAGVTPRERLLELAPEVGGEVFAQWATELRRAA